MQTVLRSNEFSCPSCVQKIEKHLDQQPGVNATKVHFTTGRIVVDHDGTPTTDALIAAIGEVGYTATARGRN
ncbi:MAG TPA: heavy metal-associated domain-containing protein [Actinomycetales bacterium]|nr:heavy metal-associated domain-containing protein [Actinomycetales bacterium]